MRRWFAPQTHRAPQKEKRSKRHCAHCEKTFVSIVVKNPPQALIVPLKSKKRVKRHCAHCEKTFVSIVVKFPLKLKKAPKALYVCFLEPALTPGIKKAEAFTSAFLF